MGFHLNIYILHTCNIYQINPHVPVFHIQLKKFEINRIGAQDAFVRVGRPFLSILGRNSTKLRSSLAQRRINVVEMRQIASNG